MLDMDVAAVHRPDRADRHAVVVAGAGRAAVIGRGHPRVRLVDEVVAEVEEPGLEALEEVRLALGRQRVGGRARREGLAALSALVLLAGAGDAEGDLGPAVPRLEHVIVDRPVASDAVGRLELHVVRDVAPGGGGPVPGRAADQLQHAGPELERAGVVDILRVVGGVGPGLVGVGRVVVLLLRRVAKVLDDLPARDAKPGFEDDHRLAGLGELVGGVGAERARAHHDHVGVELRLHTSTAPSPAAGTAAAVPPASRAARFGDRADALRRLAAPRLDAGRRRRRGDEVRRLDPVVDAGPRVGRTDGGVHRRLVHQRLGEGHEPGVVLGAERDRRAGVAEVPGRDDGRDRIAEARVARGRMGQEIVDRRGGGSRRPPRPVCRPCRGSRRRAP